MRGVTEGRTRLRATTIVAPDVDVVDDEFDHSETTNKKPRPDELDAHDEEHAHSGDDDDGDGGDEPTAAN